MELAVKYDIVEMQKEIREAMRRDWPFDLDQWDRVDRTRRCVEPASLLAFANRYDLPNVRALALYELARFDNLSEIRSYSQVYISCCYQAKEQLTLDDHRDLQFIIELQRNINFPIITCPECGDSEKGRSMEKNRSQTKKKISKTQDCLATLRNYIKWVKREWLVDCRVCRSNVTHDTKRMRETFWDILHSVGAGDRQAVWDKMVECKTPAWDFCNPTITSRLGNWAEVILDGVMPESDRHSEWSYLPIV